MLMPGRLVKRLAGRWVNFPGDSGPVPAQMPQRVHAIVKYPGDDHAVRAVIDAAPQVVEDVGCGVPSPRRQFDMERSHPGSDVIPLARTDSFGVVRDHIDRAIYKSCVTTSLPRAEPQRRLPQDVNDVLVSGLGEPGLQAGSRRLPARGGGRTGNLRNRPRRQPPGRGLCDTDTDLAPQNLKLFLVRRLLALQQPQGIAHHLTCRLVLAGSHLAFEERDELVRQAHIHRRHKASPCARSSRPA